MLRVRALLFTLALPLIGQADAMGQDQAAAPAAKPVPATTSPQSPKAPREPIKIKSDRLQIKDRDREAFWNGNVRVEQGELRLFCEQLAAHYDAQGEIATLLAEKNVRILRNKMETRSQQAAYDREAQTVVLTGKPQVTKEGNVLIGDRITYYVADDRFEVEGASAEWKPKPAAKHPAKKRGAP